MSVIDDFRKVIQDFLAPELRSIHAELKATHDIMEARFKALDEKMTYQHDAIMRELALDKRITTLERNLEEKKESQQ